MKKIINYVKENKKITILFVMSFILFLVLSILVLTDALNYIDALVHSYVLVMRNDVLTSSLTFITNFGGPYLLLAISVILIIVVKKKKIPIYILVNLVSAFIINEIMKSIFTRSRPIGINLINETGFSFPSGHSMVSLSFYGFIVYILLKRTKNKFTKGILIASLLIFVLLIGFSRIYLGVHYLSDVIAGFLLSIMYLISFINIIKLEKK